MNDQSFRGRRRNPSRTIANALKHSMAIHWAQNAVIHYAMTRLILLRARLFDGPAHHATDLQDGALIILDSDYAVPMGEISNLIAYERTAWNWSGT